MPELIDMSTQTAFIRRGNRRIHYRESCGTGPPVFILHGNSTSSEVFGPLLSGPLGRNFYCVAPDLPGHGDSSHDLNDYGIRTMADVVRDVIRHLNLESAVMVGWSLGGHVLLQASRFLEYARGYCLLGTPPLPLPVAWERLCFPHPALPVAGRRSPSLPERQQYLAAIFGGAEHVTPRDYEIFGTADGRMREILFDGLKRGDFVDEAELVRSLKTPLALVHGERDPFIRMEYLRSLSIPTLWRGSVQVIPRAGHASFRDQPAVFEPLLADFVQYCHAEGSPC